MGLCTATMMITKNLDVDTKPDNEPGFASVLIALLLLGPGMWAAAFIGLFTFAYIRLIIPTTIIGLAIWACGYYGTNTSILNRFRYRTNATDRKRIDRRLSDVRNKS